MARSVADLEAMMEVFSPSEDSSRDEEQPAFKTMDAPEPSETTVYYFESNGLTRVSPAVKQGIEEAVAAFAAKGYRTVPWRPEGMWRAAELWISLVSSSSKDSVRTLLGDGEPIPIVDEWSKTLRGKSNHPIYSLVIQMPAQYIHTQNICPITYTLNYKA